MTKEVKNVILPLEGLNVMLSYLGKQPAEEVIGMINGIHKDVKPYFEEEIMIHILNELSGRLQSYESEAKEEISKFLSAMRVAMNIDVAPIAADIDSTVATLEPFIDTYIAPVAAAVENVFAEVAPVVEAVVAVPEFTIPAVEVAAEVVPVPTIVDAAPVEAAPVVEVSPMVAL